MNLTETKKALYRENPKATLTECSNATNYYSAHLNNQEMVFFEVPHDDMGNAEFGKEMEAKLLIRWIV